MMKFKVKIKRNFLLTDITNILFVIAVAATMGAPGNFVDMIPGALGSFWYALNSIAFWGLLAFNLYGFIQNGKSSKMAFLVICFCAYVLISGIFASNLSLDAIEDCTRLCLTINAAFYIGSRRDTETIVKLLAAAQIIATLLILLMYFSGSSSVYVSDGYYDFNLIGLYTTKNSCGYEMVFGALIFYYLFRHANKIWTRVIWLAMAACQVWLAVLSRTIGAILVMAVTIIVTELLLHLMKKINLARFYIILNAGFWAVVLLVLPSLSLLLARFGKNVTLTGRTEIWQGILQFMSSGNKAHTLFGYGYGGFWGNTELTSVLYRTYGISSTNVGGHNLFLELYINIGIIGIIVFLVMVLYGLKSSKALSLSQIYFPFMMLTFVSLRGLVERTLNSRTYDTLVLFLLLALIMQIAAKRKIKENVDKIDSSDES